MIAKAVKGTGFRGALEYDLDREKGEVLDTNMAGETPRELAAEFGAVRKLRPGLNKAVLHVSLSAAPGETLTDDQWREIGQRYLKGMGLESNQYVLTKHTDTDHPHIHLLVNRITFEGQTVSDSHDYKRQESLMREIEREFNLQRVAPSKEAQRKAPTKGEIEKTIRTGQPSTRQQLQQLCDAAAKDCGSFTEYAARLEGAGVELLPVPQMGGAKLSGLSYRLDGEIMKGSDLGKGYAPLGLAKRGVTYEQVRDYPAVRRSIERATARAFGPTDAREPEQDGRGMGGADGTPSPSHGRDDRRDTGDLEGRPGAGRDPGRPGAGTDRGGRGDGDDGRVQHEPSRGGVAGGALRPVGPGRSPGGDCYSGPRDRLLALAGTTDRRHGPRSDRASDRGDPRMPRDEAGAPAAARDRTAEAVTRQLAALGVNFEVGIRDQATGKMQNRAFNWDQVQRAVPFLKRANAKGADIYIRPAGEHGLVLLDDLAPAALERMKGAGFAPAALVETSPGNFQAWLKLADQLPAEVRGRAARELAAEYGGDPNSADGRHYGRLAGFTNQKPKHTRDGRQPYVLAHDCPGQAARGAPELLRGIDDRMDREAATSERETRLEALRASQPVPGARDPVVEYRNQAKRLLERYGAGADLSRIDWMIAQDMAKSERFGQAGIERALREASPNIETRKAGHLDDYAKRTAARAWSEQSPERAQAKAKAKERENERGGHSR